MRVLLLNQTFYPDVAATAQHAHDLARHLVAAGHEVEAIASSSIYGQKGATLAKHEVVDGIVIHRVGLNLFGKSSTLGRVLDFGIFYVLAAIKCLTVRRPDVIICFTTPPLIALVGLMVRLLRGSRCVYWVMDMYPDVAVAAGMFRPRGFVTRICDVLNKWCLRRSDRTVVLGRCMLERVLAKGVPPTNLVHIDVWSDCDEVKHVAREANPYRAEWGLGSRFVVMYSGNLGLAHEIETMCRAATSPDLRNVDFVVVGGGKRKPELERFFKDHDVRCRIEPYQPRERLDDLLSCGDVHLVSIASGFEGLVVPSKLFGIMAASRPMIYIGSPASELARVILENECGFVISIGDVDSLVRAIQTMRDDPNLARAMGQRARRAMQLKYDRRIACAKWQRLLESLFAPAPEPRPPARPVDGRASTP